MNSASSLTQDITKELLFGDNHFAQTLYGDLNKNLQAIHLATDVQVYARGNAVSIIGPGHAVQLVANLLEQLYVLVSKGYPVFAQDILFAINILERTPQAKLEKIFLDKVYITAKKSVISPKSVNQKQYIDAIRNHDIVFGIGPAGTGKTYLAVAMAVAALTREQVSSIILTRPAVEAGEKLGFLPGDMAQKVDPYLRPLLDAINEMLGREKTLELMERGVIEVAPLAFMRGRTLNRAFIILDEAQNTTHEQMKMFLTRIGFDAKAVITGDITQVDLPHSRQSGLIQAKTLLKDIEGIGFTHFDTADIVRHPLVQKIIHAYEECREHT